MCELSALIYLVTTTRRRCVLIAIMLSQSEGSISATRCCPMFYRKGIKAACMGKVLRRVLATKVATS